MKKLCIDISEARAIGDTLCVSPVLRKLYYSYGRKISIITHHIDIFRNNPYIDSLYLPGDLDLTDDFEVFRTFEVNYKSDGICNKHNTIDIRQFHAISLGFMLNQEELTLDFFPSDFEEIQDLPDKYVLIHPVQNWESRTWDREKWILLVRALNASGISVVSVGKESSEMGGSDVQKPTFNLDIELGMNLQNKTSLSQTWWLIEKSECFVTMDSGLLHLAGTTDSEIIQLGSSIDNKLRAPYRKGSQEYKYHYVSGGCNLKCASDIKYGVREWNTIQGIPSLVGCLERKNTFECHPSVMDVYNKIMSTVNK
jgi:ADP-heptose:LPS heptosyltransferase